MNDTLPTKKGISFYLAESEICWSASLAYRRAVILVASGLITFFGTTIFSLPLFVVAIYVLLCWVPCLRVRGQSSHGFAAAGAGSILCLFSAAAMQPAVTADTVNFTLQLMVGVGLALYAVKKRA
jgi:hypothetical protein